MKKVFILAIAMSGLTANAQQNKFQMEQKAKQLSNQVKRIIHNQSAHMSRMELRQVIQKLKQVKQIARGQGGGHGGPIYQPPVYQPPVYQPPVVQQISLKQVILSGLNNISNTMGVSQAAKSALSHFSGPIIQSIKNSCSQASFYSQQASCFKSSLSSFQNPMFGGVQKAKDVIVSMCSSPSFYSQQASCFDAATQSANHHLIDTLTAGCKSMTNTMSKASCYKAAL